MPQRSYNSAEYRFGFNGKETDHELNDWQDYGERMYMKRLSRFPTPDPLIISEQQYPELSPYQFAGNTPIQAIDLDGLEPSYTITEKSSGREFEKPVFRSLSSDVIQSKVPTNANFGTPMEGLESKPGDLTDQAVEFFLCVIPLDKLNTLVIGKTPEGNTATTGDKVEAGVTILMSLFVPKQGKEPVYSSRAARRQAMREQKIPTSQQPLSQTNTTAGKVLQYEVPKSGGGTEIKEVQQQLKDANHGPHWEAGSTKVNGQKDAIGRNRLQNNKSKANYDPNPK